MKKYNLFLIFILIISCSEKPKELINMNASIRQSKELKENPLLMHPITSSIQPKDSTMSTLYGNDIAFNYGRSHSDSNYPKGAVLYEVTWKQKPDELWFGGNIPKEIYSVEKISFDTNNSTHYERFEGNPLSVKATDENSNDVRKEMILSQPMAVSP